MINFLGLWNKSGERYQGYALKYPQYMETNKKLVELAGPRSGQVVVDLACGTGLTTSEILRVNPEVKKVYALDFSEDMIRVAKENVSSEKVNFVVADAQFLDEVVTEKVDVILCNSSFWQFSDQKKVLEAVFRVLKPEGVFVFNLNQQFFDFGESEPNQRLIIEQIFSEMKKRGYEIEGTLKQKVNEEDIDALASSAGFEVVGVDYLDVGPRTLEDFFEFLTIPATATFFEKVSPEEQKEILVLFLMI